MDKTLKTLLEYRTKRPSSKMELIPAKDIMSVVSDVQKMFQTENTLLKVKAPVVICGDIHGQYHDLLRIFEMCGYPPSTNYLFLGDYVDRGSNSVETILLLFCLKLKYPGSVNLLRGNHESSDLTKVYGFYDECKRKYSKSDTEVNGETISGSDIGGTKVWKTFMDCFNYLPIAAVVGNRIFCAHGGLGIDLHSLNQIECVKRPILEIPSTGIICDLLWADPDKDVKAWHPSDRGVSYLFGCEPVKKFLKDNDLDLICRAHQVVEDGYEFFADKGLVTIFSAPNYDNAFTNSAAVLVVSQKMVCSFKVLEPKKTAEKSAE